MVCIELSAKNDRLKKDVLSGTSERQPLKFLYVSRSLLMLSIMEVSGAVSVSPAWDFRRSLIQLPLCKFFLIRVLDNLAQQAVVEMPVFEKFYGIMIELQHRQVGIGGSFGVRYPKQQNSLSVHCAGQYTASKRITSWR